MQIHCQRKRVSRFISDDFELSSDDSDESDKESSNESEEEYTIKLNIMIVSFLETKIYMLAFLNIWVKKNFKLENYW